jgi:hypothetical protein
MNFSEFSHGKFEMLFTFSVIFRGAGFNGVQMGQSAALLLPGIDGRSDLRSPGTRSSRFRQKSRL